MTRKNPLPVRQFSVLSLGAGVQSSAMLIAGINGDLPIKPDFGREPIPKGFGQKSASLAVERCFQDALWSPANAELCRVFDGHSPKTHRVKCGGNGVVPATAREAFGRLMGIKTN